jgi:DNA-binding beta-propeller fold protein YncE
MLPRAILASLALLALALGASAQRGKKEVELPPVYPLVPVPVDALRGHLMEGPFREPMGVFFDATANELFVCDSKSSLIGVFDPEGRPVFTFGGRALLADPKAVRVRPDGTIYVLDSEQDRIKRFSYRGERQPPLHFDYPATDDAEAGVPRIGCFTIDAEGNWYLGDLDNPQVLKYGPDLEFLLAIRPSNGGARFSVITSIDVSPEGRIAVTDFKATPVQVFDATGAFLMGFGGRDIAREDFTAPVAVRFDEEGRLFVVDLLRHDVKIFDGEGHYLAQFGGWFGPQTGGRAPGELLYPIDLAIAPEGLVYVSERYGNRVQLFSRLEPEEARALRTRTPGLPPPKQAENDG